MHGRAGAGYEGDDIRRVGLGRLGPRLVVLAREEQGLDVRAERDVLATDFFKKCTALGRRQFERPTEQHFDFAPPFRGHFEGHVDV
ncbi:MAG: hypothetical protein IPF53_05445 [Blastocatellia bacterium]|nr:hypothetical protein [Blastocatellia bacterium]